MTIKKGDLVKIKQSSSTVDYCNDSFGIVIKGPYEEQITITSSPFPVTVVELVCDIIIGEKILKAISIDHLQRHHQKHPDADS